jgi:ribonuclease H2 subunit A
MVGWVMGIDEAGRGPVLGPMVYGACACPSSFLAELSGLGFADSKQLSKEDRERLFKDIQQQKEILALHTVLDPERLSADMLRREKISLNAISHDTAIDLVRQVRARGIALEHVYIDTVGDANKYQAKMCAIFPGVNFTVASKADSKYPIVSAASIVAKVIRDERLEQWEFPEENKQNSISRDFGCGYPSDPITKAWLRNNLDTVFGFPSIVRFSWSTCTKLLDQHAVTVEWNDEAQDTDQDQASISKFFNGSKDIKRGKFFKEKKLSLVSNW